MAFNITNVQQFIQCLHDVTSPVNNLRAAAELALRSLETDHVLTEEEEYTRMVAGVMLKNSLKKNAIMPSLYDRIFEHYLIITGDSNKSRPNLKVLGYILAGLVLNQLANNIDVIFNKYMRIFDDYSQTDRITQAIGAAELLFEERSDLVKAHYENSSRLQLLFDKLVHLLSMNGSKFSRYIYPVLSEALKSAEYLSDESVRSLVLQRALELIDSGQAMGYQVLGACLSQVYEHLEPFMERLIKGVKRINDSPTLEEENTYGFEGRAEKVFLFWTDLCCFEQRIREDNEEFLYLEIQPPVPYLELLRRYGDQVIEQVMVLMGSMVQEYQGTPPEDCFWYSISTQCLSEISNAFNIDISPYLDKVPAGRTKLLLSAESHWTETFAKIKDDSFSEGVYPINLRLSPSFLVTAADSAWTGIGDPQRLIKVKDTFIAGAGEYLPMYHTSVQDKCIQVACHNIIFAQQKRVDGLAEVLRLNMAHEYFSKPIFSSLQIYLKSTRDSQSDAEIKCFRTLAQLYSVPETTLQTFIEQSVKFMKNFNQDSRIELYNLIKPLQQAPSQSNVIFKEIILAELEEEKGKYDNALILLGLLCQKLGAAIPSEMYSEIWTTLRLLSHHSYNIFETMTYITPPAGVSYLSHLETIIDLFELKLRVTDDVHVEFAIRGLTTLLYAFKKSSNEFLFVGQIKRIIGALQPALENDPSIETMRAYLTFIRSLSTIDQASSTLRTESVMSVLKHASEQSDGTTRHLALNVKEALE